MRPKKQKKSTIPDLKRIISAGEGQLIEFKEISGGINPKALAQTIAAFANTDGGDIYIGIADAGTVIGTQVNTISFDHILNAAREICQPAIEIDIQTISINKKNVIRISVDRSLMLHSLSNGMVYVRVGSQDKRIVGEDIARLATAKSLVSYEDYPIEGAQISDLDQELIKDLQHSPINSGRMKKLMPQEVLKAYQLIDKNGYLTCAAILLFAKKPDAWIFNAGAAFVHFAGEQITSGSEEGEMGYLDREDIPLPLTPLIDQLFNKITNSIEKGSQISGVKRTENWEYPPSVYRECIVNALVHRDYRISAARPEVHLYSDHLEVHSPGALPGFMTIETLGKRHYPRNPKLMRCLSDWGYVESLGLGIATIKKTLSKLGFPPPRWENYPDEFRAIIQKRPFMRIQSARHGELPPKDRETLDYIYKTGSINRQEYMRLHQVTLSKAKVELRRLVDKKIIKLVGKGPASHYIVES